MGNPIKTMLRRFRRDEEGSIAVEAVLIFPMLTWCYLATFVYFDAFRAQATALKAAYTISDAVSRIAPEEYFTNSYLNSMWYLHRFLTTSNHQTDIRVTSVTYDDDTDKFGRAWSREKGDRPVLSSNDVNNMRSQIPDIPESSTLIMVETWVVYEPVFSIGIEAFEFENRIFTRPRFTPKVCWDSNGDGVGAECG